MSAGRSNILIEKGTTFQKTYYYKTGKLASSPAVDLTGYTARAQIRESIDSKTVVAEMTTENGGITITGSEGKIELLISATETADISIEAGVWDLELIDGAIVKRLVYGSVAVSEGVTR